MKTEKPTEEPVEITDTWIRGEIERRRQIRRTTPGAKFQKHYTCSREKGFMVWFARDLTVSLCLRVRVKHPGSKSKRHFEVIGHWVDPKAIKSDVALTVARAKNKATLLKAQYAEYGLAIAATIPLLEDAIEEYVVARRDKKDPRTSKRRAPLPKEWDERIERFKAMFKDYLKQPTSVLTYDNMLDIRNAYAAANHGDPEGKPSDKALRKVRAIFTTTMPMLKWWRDAKGYMPHAGMIEGLTPEGYKKNSRFLYPGEWQKARPHIDALGYTSEFLRFVFATGVRTETALGMEWDEFDLNNPDTFTDFDGNKQDMLVWIVPAEEGRLKGRGADKDEEEGELERRILICGDALKIIRTMRNVYEADKDKKPGDIHVWPKKVRTLWRSKASKTQRAIEAAAGTARWNRYTLRKSHTTYLEYLQCPSDLLSVTLTHTAPEVEGAAPVTKEHYRHADAASRAMGEHDPLVRLAPWHVKLHKLIRDMEDGTPSAELQAIQRELRRGTKSSKMRDRYLAGDASMIEVEERGPRLRAVA